MRLYFDCSELFLNCFGVNMTISSVGTPINGLSSYSVNQPPRLQVEAKPVTHVAESSQVQLSPEAKQLTAQSVNSQSVPSSTSAATEKLEIESSSWLDDVIDSILPDDSEGSDEPGGKEDDCSCTMGKYLKAAASIGSVIALFA